MGDADHLKMAGTRSHDVLERHGRDEVLGTLGDVIEQGKDDWVRWVSQGRAGVPGAELDMATVMTDWQLRSLSGVGSDRLLARVDAEITTFQDCDADDEDGEEEEVSVETTVAVGLVIAPVRGVVGC